MAVNRDYSSFKEMDSWSTTTAAMMTEAFVDLPRSDDARYVFWLSVIKDHCFLTRSAVFDSVALSELVKSRVGIAPRCIDTVGKAGLRDKVIYTVKDYKGGLHRLEKLPWWKALYEKVFGGQERTSSDENLILPQIVKSYAESIYKAYSQRSPGTDETVSLIYLKALSTGIVQDTCSFEIVLIYLQAHHLGFVQVSDEGNKYVTFIQDITMFRVPSKETLTILDLQKMIRDCKQEIERILKEIQKCEKEEDRHKKALNVEQLQVCRILKRDLQNDLDRRQCELKDLHTKLEAVKEKRNDNIKRGAEGNASSDSKRKK